MENEIFKSLSDQEIGPRLHFQNEEYRIEDFFVSRPLSIWEMRNEIFMGAYAEKICEFNFNEKLREQVLRFAPMNKQYINIIADEWHTEVADKLPEIRDK